MRVTASIRHGNRIAASAVLLLFYAALLAVPLRSQTIRVQSPRRPTHAVSAMRGTLRPASLLGTTTIALSATPTTVSFTLVANGSAVANNAIAITSTVTLPLSTSINVYGYFVTSTTALTGSASGSKIPTSAVYGIVPTGVPTGYTAFTQTGPFGGANASLLLVALSGITVLHIETDNLTLKINLSGVPIPADTYTGTMYIQGQAF